MVFLSTSRGSIAGTFPGKGAGIAAILLLAIPSFCDAQWQWEQKSSSGPTPRGEYGMAFDAARIETLLLGGSNNLTFNGVNQQTWSWNGSDWTLEAEAGPSARCDQAMAFDSQRQVVVIFGGYNGTYLGDTWEWDGAIWIQRVGAGPSARADSFMAYDSQRGVMVLLGGQNSLGTVLNDTWEWDGNTWVHRTPPVSPPVRWIHRMAYDSLRGVVVVFGGAGTVSARGDTWEWDGTNWMQKNPASSPPARYGNGLTYDSKRGLVILFGGQSGFNFGQNPLGDTWAWDGSNWSQLTATGPSARTFVKIAYDRYHDRTVTFGGYNGTQFMNDTWELTGPPPPVPAVTTWGLLVTALTIGACGSAIAVRRRAHPSS